MSARKIRSSKASVTPIKAKAATPAPTQVKAAVKAATAPQAPVVVDIRVAADKGASKPTTPVQAPAKAATDAQAPAAPTTPAQKAIAAPTATPDGVLRIPQTVGGSYSSHACSTLEEAQRIYRRLQNGAGGNLEPAEYYSKGLLVARVNKRGVAIDLKGAIIADAPTLAEARTAIDQKAEQLEPAQSVVIPATFITAALAVAAKKDQARPYLCSVYIHQIDGQLRIVSGDGHRIMVSSQACPTHLTWGHDGVMIGRDDLERIAKFIGKGEAAQFEISYGLKHQHVVIREVGGIGTFTVTPGEGKYVDYQHVLNNLKVFSGGERKPTEATCMNPAYMKAAGAIAASLESPGVYAFMDEATGPCAFTFEGVAGAVLIVMPIRVERPQAALPAATARLLGPQAMRGSIAALKAHATRIDKQMAVTTDKAELAKLEAQKKGFTDRAAELTAIMAVKIEGKATIVPDAPKDAPKAGSEAAAK